MTTSIIQAQRHVILQTIHHITKGEWKVLVVDRDSKRVLDNVIEEDAILNENITNIEFVMERRPTNRDVDALYFLSPQSHIVDCLMGDFSKRKYRRAHLVWTSLLHPNLRERLDKSHTAREQIAQFTTLNVEFYPRESHLITFRDPWSFPILYHPACNHLVRQHMEDIAQKIVGVCVALGEYPTIRYYRPPQPHHEASILCAHLARFVQDELDLYAKFHQDFPPPSNRPRGSIYICDRSMDLLSPFLHEFTYQAMAHDLLPIKEADQTTYRTTINEGQRDQEEKDIPITEKDRLWTENRHRHMKDVIEKLMADFQKFLKENPNFTNKGAADLGGMQGLHAIKDMMAGLPQFQEMKEAYALHLGMAQESMNRFAKWKLGDVSVVEQTCATGQDEDYKKPKHLADQVVRMLDEDDLQPPDRLRLLILYILYRDGLLPTDLQRLLNHAQLAPQDGQLISNLELLGARTQRGLNDPRPPPPALFPKKPPPSKGSQEEILISRYEPALQLLLQAHGAGTVSQETYPYTKPPLDEDGLMPSISTASSLRSAKPTWARTRTTGTTENRQRIIVFMAGGATYAEARACYDVGKATSREVYLITSHMLSPTLFLRQVGDLSQDRRRLGLPTDQPKEKAPSHLFEEDPGMRQAQQGMQNMSMNGTQQPQGQPQGPRVQPGGGSGGVRGTDRRPFNPNPPQQQPQSQQQQSQQQSSQYRQQQQAEYQARMAQQEKLIREQREKDKKKKKFFG